MPELLGLGIDESVTSGDGSLGLTPSGSLLSVQCGCAVSAGHTSRTGGELVWNQHFLGQSGNKRNVVQQRCFLSIFTGLMKGVWIVSLHKECIILSLIFSLCLFQFHYEKQSPCYLHCLFHLWFYWRDSDSELESREVLKHFWWSPN